MINNILSNIAASISDLKKNPMKVVMQCDGQTVAILNHNKPAFYCVPAKSYEALMKSLEDVELNKIADKRFNHKRIKVNLDKI